MKIASTILLSALTGTLATSAVHAKTQTKKNFAVYKLPTEKFLEDYMPKILALSLSLRALPYLLPKKSPYRPPSEEEIKTLLEEASRKFLPNSKFEASQLIIKKVDASYLVSWQGFESEDKKIGFISLNKILDDTDKDKLAFKALLSSEPKYLKTSKAKENVFEILKKYFAPDDDDDDKEKVQRTRQSLFVLR